MQRAGSILKKFLSNYGLESGLTLASIRNQWTGLVGDSIAEHSSPDIIKGRTIFVNVDSPQWMHHLTFYKQDICDKLSRFNITDVRFKIGRLSRQLPVKQEMPGIHLNDEDCRYIERTIKNIKDDELKERLRKLFTNALKSRKGRGSSCLD